MTKEDIKFYYEILIQEAELHLSNLKILSSNYIPFEDFKSIRVDCETSGEIEIVDHPSGENQNEIYGVFKEVWVDQWSTNMDGDAFEGFIYGRFKKDKWLKIPFIA